MKGELPVCTMAPLIQDTLLVPLSSCIEITENELSVQSFTISYEQNPTNKPYGKCNKNTCVRKFLIATEEKLTTIQEKSSQLNVQ